MPRSLQWPGHSLAFTHSAPGGARRRDFLAGSLSTPSLLWRVLYHVTLAPGKGTCESCFSMGTSLYSKQLHRGLYMWYLLSSALHWRAHSQFFTPSIPQYIVAFGASETRQAARDSSLQEGPVRPTGQLQAGTGTPARCQMALMVRFGGYTAGGVQRGGCRQRKQLARRASPCLLMNDIVQRGAPAAWMRSGMAMRALAPPLRLDARPMVAATCRARRLEDLLPKRQPRADQQEGGGNGGDAEHGACWGGTPPLALSSAQPLLSR
mmetsp:Transcript_66351/g.209758  ORF Transcript_66351/g.209758 Transcript_66351/m.209758 type:complete len:265 (+) Transcript_66351:1966-2760(+)